MGILEYKQLFQYHLIQFIYGNSLNWYVPLTVQPREPIPRDYYNITIQHMIILAVIGSERSP